MEQLRVALGVIKNSSGKVLLAQRNKAKHLDKYWEFPGGKVNDDESYKSALRRELYEEVNIEVLAVIKKFDFSYQYPEFLISFQVFDILNYQGGVTGAEAQNIQWVSVDELVKLQLPPANQSIIDALQLSPQYMIADVGVLGDSLLDIVQRQLSNGVEIVQLRGNSLSKSDYLSLANTLFQMCLSKNVKFVVNCNLDWLGEVATNYFHLSSNQLKKISSAQKQTKKLLPFSVACHDENEIRLANSVGARCILLGAVNKTQSHLSSQPLGWEKFSQLASIANIPVYALGGLSIEDIPTIRAFGGQGVAGIRCFFR